MRSMMLIATMITIAFVAPTTNATTFLKKTLDQWRKDLESSDREVRRSAAFALGQIGSPIAVKELVDRMKNDKEPGVREMAARAVGDIIVSLRQRSKPDHEWTVAGKALEAALKDGDPRVRRSAAYALGAFGEQAATSIPSLKVALRDKAPTVRQNAAWAIGKMGDPGEETVLELCALLGDESPIVKRLTASALSEVTAKQVKKSPETPLALLKMLENEKDDVVCRTGLGALATMADKSLQKHASKIYPLLGSKDPETARATAFVLANMGGEPATRAIGHLQTALRDPDAGIQTLAAACLANAGVAAAPAIEDLSKALDRSTNAEVRRNCVIALGLITKELRKGRDPGLLDKTAPVALTALMKALEVKAEIKDDVSTARAKEQIREDATEAIGNMGYPHNEKAFSLIGELLRKEDNQMIRQRCVWAIFSCNDIDRHDDLKKALIKVLDETSDPSLMVRYDAARYLAFSLKEKAPDRTADVLLHMLGNNGLKVFAGTGTAVDGIGDESKRGSARVTTRSGGDARYMAAEALASIAPKLKGNDKALKALEVAAKDSDPELSKKAALAIEAIKK